MASRIVTQKYRRKMDKFVKVYEIRNDDHNDKIFEEHSKHLKFLGIVE